MHTAHSRARCAERALDPHLVAVAASTRGGCDGYHGIFDNGRLVVAVVVDGTIRTAWSARLELAGWGDARRYRLVFSSTRLTGPSPEQVRMALGTTLDGPDADAAADAVGWRTDEVHAAKAAVRSRRIASRQLVNVVCPTTEVLDALAAEWVAGASTRAEEYRRAEARRYTDRARTDLL